MTLDWLSGWYAFVDEARQHGQAPELTQFAMVTTRGTFENWQPEFLQLLWQAVGAGLFPLRGIARLEGK